MAPGSQHPAPRTRAAQAADAERDRAQAQEDLRATVTLLQQLLQEQAQTV